jgi:hypothetical protein
MPLLRVGIDLGTGYSGIAVQRLQEDATSKPANITVVPPKDGYASPPNAFKQVSVYHNDILYCGKDVEGILSANPDLQDKVMELNKLALHPLFDDVAEVVHVKQVLPARDRAALQGFFADLLRYFIGEIRDFMKREYPLVEGRESTDYWNDISLEFQISVPAMWGDSQRGVLRNAAKHAGVAKVELREEALCVAIDYMLYRIERDQIKPDECLLLIDCGKGTLDIATVKLVQVLTPEHDMELQRIGLCSGDGSGAHTPNPLLWAWILSGECPKVGNLEDECMSLAITQREFMRQVCDEFDTIKERFSPVPNSHRIAVYGSAYTTPGDNALDIWVSREQVLAWYHVWTEAVKKLLREHLDKSKDQQIRFACAELTGGGANCVQFREAVKEVLSETQHSIQIRYTTVTAVTLPCARGALMHHLFQEDSLPGTSVFYIAQDMFYKPGQHRKDAVQTSQWDTTEEIVRDRLQRIMTYEDEAFSEEVLLPLTFYVSAEGSLGRLHVDLYWSEQKIRSSIALRDNEGNVKPGIRCYPMVFADIPDLADHDFVAESAKVASHFFVRAWVGMKGSKEKLELVLYVMKNYYEYPPEPDEPQKRSRKNAIPRKTPTRRQDIDDGDILETFTEGVWDKDSSHFVVRSTGTANSRGGNQDH